MSLTGPGAVPRLLKSPSQFFAFGFGAGLSPAAPGTVGTLVALPLVWWLQLLPWWQYGLFLLFAVLFGTWVCGRASAELGVHDHPGIVWDEFAGIWIAFWGVPRELTWLIIGFLVFRFLDIMKPAPIGWADRRVTGGWGIMVDDVLAGALTCVALHLAIILLPPEVLPS